MVLASCAAGSGLEPYEVRPVKPNDRLSGLRVLIVEDCVELASLFAWILRGAGAVVTVAHDRRHGLMALFASPPDILLCDLDLPEGSGLAIVRALRLDEEHSGRYLPAAAVTSLGGEEVERECLEAGFDEYILKPVEPTPLVELVERLGSHRRALEGTSLGARVRNMVDALDNAGASTTRST